MFKSYYVVWKRKVKWSETQTHISFKSYYVVWKRKKNFLETYTHSSFKSYYVVWKLGVRQLQKAKLERSLNRTMQYGNTPKKRIIPKIRPGLNRTMQYGNYSGILKKKNIGSGFKSYYVVWKRPPFCAITFCATWFKSYYVVWKLYFILCYIYILYCLNRTMQYGNPHLSLVRLQVVECLNRTMQYGNHTKLQRRKMENIV